MIKKLFNIFKSKNMIPLKDAIKEKHKKAETMPFNQRMFSGGMSGEEYITYLYQQFSIFNAIERYPLPHESLYRSSEVLGDIGELHHNSSQLEMVFMPSTIQYTNYLEKLSKEELLPHVYLNYLALVFGGKLMKHKTPGGGRMYDFDGDLNSMIASIRMIQKDEWADEVNKGLDYIIQIFDELAKHHNITD